MTVQLPPKNGRTPRAAAFAALCFVLAGCNAASDSANVSLEQSVATPQPAAQMMALTTDGPATHAPAQPLAGLPSDAGAVASVRSQNYVNGFRQDIVLKGGANHSVPNSLTILARTSRQATLDEATPLFQPTEPAIRAELGRQFPHIAMQIVERSSSNAYGPYGLALGRGEGTVRCLYMWQWIDENRLPQEAGVSGPVSVRIRLCQAGTTFDAMAALVDHLTIGPDAATSYALAANDSGAILAEPAKAEPATQARKRAKRHTARSPTADARRHPGGAEPSPGMLQSVVSGAAIPAPLSTDLPPQAYLGPKPGSAATRAN